MAEYDPGLAQIMDLDRSKARAAREREVGKSCGIAPGPLSTI